MQYLLIGHVHPFAAVSSLAINILPHNQRSVKHWWGEPEQAKLCRWPHTPTYTAIHPAGGATIIALHGHGLSLTNHELAVLCTSGLTCRSYQVLTWSKPHHCINKPALSCDRQTYSINLSGVAMCAALLQMHSTWVNHLCSRFVSCWCYSLTVALHPHTFSQLS